MPTLTPKRIAKITTGLTGLSGTVGVLSLMGAFGPVSCWKSVSETDTAGDTTTTTVIRGCESGIDYLLGTTTGNAPVLFFWAIALLVLTLVGTTAGWTGHRYTTWVTAAIGGVVSIIGLMSIGWYFVLPTLCLVITGTALTLDARRADSNRKD